MFPLFYFFIKEKNLNLIWKEKHKMLLFLLIKLLKINYQKLKILIN